MERQEKDMIIKCQHYDVIKNINKCNKNFTKNYIESVMKDAWGCQNNWPKNGFSLTKSYLRRQCEAIKNGKTLEVPKICDGFIIIDVSTINIK